MAHSLRVSGDHQCMHNRIKSCTLTQQLLSCKKHCVHMTSDHHV